MKYYRFDDFTNGYLSNIADFDIYRYMYVCSFIRQQSSGMYKVYLSKKDN